MYSGCKEVYIYDGFHVIFIFSLYANRRGGGGNR